MALYGFVDVVGGGCGATVGGGLFVAHAVSTVVEGAGDVVTRYLGGLVVFVVVN